MVCIDNIKLDKKFFARFISFLVIPGLIYLSFMAINVLSNMKLSRFFEPFLLAASLSILFCIAFFIVPLKAYQFTFLPPASWEKTIFFENWIYFEIMYLFALAFILAIFTKKWKLGYSWAIYIVTLVGSRIIMHVSLHLFGLKAYFDFP